MVVLVQSAKIILEFNLYSKNLWYLKGIKKITIKQRKDNFLVLGLAHMVIFGTLLTTIFIGKSMQDFFTSRKFSACDFVIKQVFFKGI